MTDFQGPRCETCRYLLVGDNVCRRFPPVAVFLPKDRLGDDKTRYEDRIQSYFPTMLPSGWCGEWVVK